MLQVGDALPDATLVEKHKEVRIHDIFKGARATNQEAAARFVRCCAHARR
jgi:hypothetical protein